MIVLFAAVGLLLLFLYDKRSSLITFFKEKVFKPKPVKLPKVKQPKDITKQKDQDKEIKSDNISYGSFELPKEEVQETEKKEPSFFGNTIFDPVMHEDDDDDFDIDKMLSEIEDERRETDIKTYASEILDGAYLPDFDSMSIGDLDSLLEDNFDSDYVTYGNYLPALDDELSGEELGEVIKSLPKSIKILIINDIFKKKF